MPKQTHTKTQKAAKPQKAMEREDQIMNTIANTTVLLTSAMMSAFSGAMTQMADAMASGIAGALGGEEAQAAAHADLKKNLPEVDKKIAAMVSDIRRDVYAQLEQKRKEMEPMISDHAFDAGPRIVERYHFSLPKLTQQLDDKALAQYTQLLLTEDPQFAKMFKELGEWLSPLQKYLEKPKR